jgi:hypothetical protein
MLGLAGCTTYQSKITPETRQIVKTVSICNTVYAPSNINAGNASANGGGLVEVLLVGAVNTYMTKSFDGKLRSQLNPTEYLSQTLLSDFKAKLASCTLFTLTTNETADASFVLEVSRAGIGEPKQWPLSGWGTCPPEVEVVVTLISKPPFDLKKVDVGRGRIGITPEDPTLHKILYRKFVFVRGSDGLPYYKKKEYLTKDVFEKAFGQAISTAVDKITDDW